MFGAEGGIEEVTCEDICTFVIADIFLLTIHVRRRHVDLETQVTKPILVEREAIVVVEAVVLAARDERGKYTSRRQY